MSLLFSFEFNLEALHAMILLALLSLLLEKQERDSTPLSPSGSIETADKGETPLESAPKAI